MNQNMAHNFRFAPVYTCHKSHTKLPTPIGPLNTKICKAGPEHIFPPICRSDAQRAAKQKERKEKELELCAFNAEQIEDSSHTHSLVDFHNYHSHS